MQQHPETVEGLKIYLQYLVSEIKACHLKIHRLDKEIIECKRMLGMKGSPQNEQLQ